MSNFYTTEVRLGSMSVTTVAYSSDSGASIISLVKTIEGDEGRVHFRTDLNLPYEVLEEAFRLATLARERVLSEGKDLEFFWPRELLSDAV
jgi:hypothetical protein